MTQKQPCCCNPCCCPPPPVENPSLSFRKTGENGLPLSGGTFSLSNGASASSVDGTVDFGTLEPGTYTLTETQAPEGYLPDETVYTVEVRGDGQVLIGGIPAEDFVLANAPEAALDPSPRPVISSIVEGDRFIHGTGVPGATVVVSLPDGHSLTTTVNADGVWLVPVPDGSELLAGDTVYASQTVPGYGPSEEASFLVQPRG